MIKLHTIGQIEKQYPYEDAVIETDMLNGDFGSVSDGKFTHAANASKAIMQVEVGDDMGMPQYPIAANSHVRVIDMAKIDGQLIEIYGSPLPSTYAVGDKLVSEATGLLATGGSTAPYYEIKEIIGNYDGVVAKVVATSD